MGGPDVTRRGREATGGEDRKASKVLPRRVATGFTKIASCASAPEGNPEFATILKVVKALGLRLHATPQ
ncbi:MAG: hypothetical protein FJ118_17435 [Deltaproteobacteria bacterium]|nr:hypothetical protein [Deltaproteobacteria bacterium]